MSEKKQDKRISQADGFTHKGRRNRNPVADLVEFGTLCDLDDNVIFHHFWPLNASATDRTWPFSKLNQHCNVYNKV
jgi:hypothetical protein